MPEGSCVCGTVPFLKVVDPKRKEGKVDGDVLASRERERVSSSSLIIYVSGFALLSYGETRLFFGQAGDGWILSLCVGFIDDEFYFLHCATCCPHTVVAAPINPQTPTFSYGISQPKEKQQQHKKLKAKKEMTLPTFSYSRESAACWLLATSPHTYTIGEEKKNDIHRYRCDVNHKRGVHIQQQQHRRGNNNGGVI